MTLTYRATDIAYEDARYNFIAKRELSPTVGYNYYPQNVGDNKVTMGAGLNLTDGKPTNRYAVYITLGINADVKTGLALKMIGTAAQQTAEQSYIDRLDAILTNKTLTISQKRVQLDAVMVTRAADSSLDGYADNRKSYFVFESDAQVRQSFDLAEQFYEQDLQKRLNQYAPNVYADPAFTTSKEHVALLSMIWVGGPGGVSTELMSAMNSHNRAEAWFEIRYKANKLGYKISQNPGVALSGKDLNDYNHNFDEGWANRRYAEAQLFGLYDPAADKLAEAKDIYRMFTNHREQIAAYEKVYGESFDGTSGTRGNNLGNASYAIRQTLGFACVTLLGDLAGNTNADIANAYQKWVANGGDPLTFNPTNLYLGSGFSGELDATVNETATGSNDILLVDDTAPLRNWTLRGGKGDDLLIGGGDNDSLYGGSGTDVLAGGGGDDSYYVQTGETVTIEDKAGTNHIFLDSKALATFYRLVGGDYISYDGSFTGTLSNGEFVVMDKSGTKITLNANFQEGDFGITFKDAPTDTAASNVQIFTYQPGQGGRGNWVTMHHLSDELSAEFLDFKPVYDLTNNQPLQSESTMGWMGLTGYDDHYTGSDGNEMIGVMTDGGNDTVDGGAGHDYIRTGSGNDVLIGGTGSDLLSGGAGNDRLYGEAQSSTAEAIASGNLPGTGINQRGDWLSGGTGDDILVGSTSNDVLMGGEGQDLLIAGAGDDHLYGDLNWDAIRFEWQQNPGYIWNMIDTPAPLLTGGDDTLYGGAGNENLDCSKTNGAVCAVLFGRSECTAVNDARYQTESKVA